MESAGVDEMGKRQRQACIAGRFVPPCAQGADGTSQKGIFDPDPEMVKEPELYAWAESLLKEDKIRQEGYFDPEMVTRLWKDFTQRGIWRKQIWHILRFEDWLEQEYRKP